MHEAVDFSSSLSRTTIFSRHSKGVETGVRSRARDPPSRIDVIVLVARRPKPHVAAMLATALSTLPKQFVAVGSPPRSCQSRVGCVLAVIVHKLPLSAPPLLPPPRHLYRGRPFVSQCPSPFGTRRFTRCSMTSLVSTSEHEPLAFLPRKPSATS
eukprot:6200583-Pleurochrysis_carterae.AAC.2